jgi:hypothetical protein
MGPYDYWMMFIHVYFWPVLALGTAVAGGRLARRYIKAVEGRAEAKVEQAQLTARVAELEGALEEAHDAVTRLEAAQEFTTRLLSERVGERL